MVPKALSQLKSGRSCAGLVQVILAARELVNAIARSCVLLLLSGSSILSPPLSLSVRVDKDAPIRTEHSVASSQSFDQRSVFALIAAT